jgi:hypothetical protein
MIVPRLGDFSPAIIPNAGEFSGGDKPRPYLSGEAPFVVAGFIPAWIGMSK